jgi:hypothetical protein
VTDMERLIEAVEAGTVAQTTNAIVRYATWQAVAIGPDLDTPGLASRAYNGSLDAALRLHEALLPGWGWAVDWRDDGFVMAWLSPNLNRMPEAERAAAPLVDERNYSGKPARSWLLAILRALAKREEG